MTTPVFQPAPLVLPLDIDLERRLDRILCKGEMDDPALMLLAGLPPWLDASQAAKCLGASWKNLRLAWPSAEVRDAITYAAASPHGMSPLGDAIAAVLPHVTEAVLGEALDRMLLQATISRGWLDPQGCGDHVAMLAAATALDPDHAGDVLRYAATAAAYAPLAFGAERRLFATAPDLSFLCERAVSEIETVKSASLAFWHVVGTYAALPKAERAIEHHDEPGAWSHGAAIVRDADRLGAEPALLAWRDCALAAIGGGIAPPEALEAVAELAWWGPNARRMVRRVLETVEALGFDKRCRTDLMLTVRRDLHVWAALAGDAEAARIAAVSSLASVFQAGVPPAERIRALGHFLGFLRVAAAGTPLALVSFFRLRGRPDFQDLAGEGATKVVSSTAATILRAIENAPWQPAGTGVVSCETLWARAEVVPDAARFPLASTQVETSVPEDGGIVVLPSLVSAKVGSGGDIERDWGPLAGRRFPLAPVPDLGDVRRTILASFPHCREVVDRLLGDLVGRSSVRLRPTLLLGSPGCGKTTLARVVLDALGIPFQVYPAGGVADATLIGTSRQWATARPSVPLQQIRASGVGNPGIIIDEIEKAASAPNNGRLQDALLGYLDETTSQSVFDFLLETNVNLSMMTWLATANHVDALSQPLRDRFRVIRVPDPGPDDLPVLLPAVMKQIGAEQSGSADWLQPLAPDEIDLIAGVWKPRSLRRLTKVVRRLLEKRDELQPRH